MVLNTVSKPPLVTSYFASLNNRPSDIVLPFFLLFLSDKTFRFYKSSVASASGRSTPARGFSFDVMRPNAEPQTQTQTQASSQTMMTKDGKEAWEVDMEGSSLPESESRFSFFLFFVLSSGDSRRERKDGGFFLCFFLVFPWVILYIWAGPKSCCGDHLLICVMVLVSPLPVIKNAAESERVAADSRMDRMTIWMRNVESKFHPKPVLCPKSNSQPKSLQRSSKTPSKTSPPPRPQRKISRSPLYLFRSRVLRRRTARPDSHVGCSLPARSSRRMRMETSVQWEIRR